MGSFSFIIGTARVLGQSFNSGLNCFIDERLWRCWTVLQQVLEVTVAFWGEKVVVWDSRTFVRGEGEARLICGLIIKIK